MWNGRDGCTVVGLYSINSNKVLDYLLSKRNFPLSLLRGQKEFNAYMYDNKTHVEKYEKNIALSSGGFSKVYLGNTFLYLVRERSTGNIYAMKEFKTSLHPREIQNEVSILKAISICPFAAAFHDFVYTVTFIMLLIECSARHYYGILFWL